MDHILKNCQVRRGILADAQRGQSVGGGDADERDDATLKDEECCFDHRKYFDGRSVGERALLTGGADHQLTRPDGVVMGRDATRSVFAY
jgi:hypothetical protein